MSNMQWRLQTARDLARTALALTGLYYVLHLLVPVIRPEWANWFCDAFAATTTFAVLVTVSVTHGFVGAIVSAIKYKPPTDEQVNEIVEAILLEAEALITDPYSLLSDEDWRTLKRAQQIIAARAAKQR